jgi:hypothetical protein
MPTSQAILQIVDQRVGTHTPLSLQRPGAVRDGAVLAEAAHDDRLIVGEVEQAPEAGVGGAFVHLGGLTR